jgi:hypothetical protein
VGPFGLGDGPLNGNMIDLPIIVSLLPLGIEISVGASSDCEDCVVSRKTVSLLWRLVDL